MVPPAFQAARPSSHWLDVISRMGNPAESGASASSGASLLLKGRFQKPGCCSPLPREFFAFDIRRLALPKTMSAEMALEEETGGESRVWLETQVLESPWRLLTSQTLPGIRRGPVCSPHCQSRWRLHLGGFSHGSRSVLQTVQTAGQPPLPWV